MRVIETGDKEFMLVLYKGEDLVQELTGFARKRGIQSGYLYQGIGMLEKTVLGYYNGREYEKEDIADPVELIGLAGNLTLKQGEPLWHLHCTLAQEGGAALGGHLFSAEVSVTAEIYFRAFDRSISREQVSENLWLISRE